MHRWCEPLLEDIKAKRSKAAATNPRDFVDMGSVEELERLGLSSSYMAGRIHQNVTYAVHYSLALLF